jgi:cytochrome c556
LIFRKFVIALLVTFMAIFIVPAPSLAGDKETKPTIDLSPELIALLRAEMAELSGGIQSIALFIATADWKAIEETSDKMHGSYIMKQSLTQPQAMELKRKLPHEFKQLDAAFHARAKQLGHAAASEDPELVAFHYSRLVETCAGCHSAFAKKRFPGFEHAPIEQHEH